MRSAVELLNRVGEPIYLALDDEVGVLLDSHPDLAPGAEPVAGSAAHILEVVGPAADSLSADARAALTPWLDAQVTRRAIGVRYGYGASLIWQNDRDPQVTAAMSALNASRRGNRASRER